MKLYFKIHFQGLSDWVQDSSFMHHDINLRMWVHFVRLYLLDVSVMKSNMNESVLTD